MQKAETNYLVVTKCITSSCSQEFSTAGGEHPIDSTHSQNVEKGKVWTKFYFGPNQKLMPDYNNQTKAQWTIDKRPLNFLNLLKNNESLIATIFIMNTIINT